MNISKAPIVADVLRDFPNEGNGWMILKHESPQPNYTTKGGRTYQSEGDPDILESRIAGYSLYTSKNAGGEYNLMVAHKPGSHAMTAIKVATSVDMDKVQAIVKTIRDFFTQEEINSVGGESDLIGLLLTLHKYGYTDGNEARTEYVNKNAGLLEKHLGELTLTPFLSDACAHEMLAVHEGETVEEAVKKTGSLSKTVWF